MEALNQWSVSPVVTDRSGHTLLRIVGSDDQWRQPVPLDEISPWMVQATIAVEDERFRLHPGVDPIAIVRATGQNILNRDIVSGASTITMQVCRMMDKRPRTVKAKTVEAFRALQLECILSKEEIIEKYLNIAPYGGNIRGVESASRIYFGKRARDLSLGEAALLTGLPKSPTAYRPDRYPETARMRRSTVLRRMAELDMITEEQRAAADAEPVFMAGPIREHAAPHAAWLALQRRQEGGRTTIDIHIQREVERLAEDRARLLPEGTDQAVVVIEIQSGDIVALLGSSDYWDTVDGQVNGVLARRSPGSALKPFIYAAAFEARRLRPDSVVYDVPIERAGWSPRNFDRTFSGELTAAEALRRSLNVPAIRCTIAPRPWNSWMVLRPLKPPAAIGSRLRILSPAPGSTFIALSGRAVIRPTATADKYLVWFLNGKMLNEAKRLELPGGHYELLCVNGRGQSSRANFTVQY